MYRPRMKARRSRKARDKLINQYVALPYAVWRSIRHRLPSANFDDVISYGNEALMRAADLWDETKGVLFYTYARRAIERQIIQQCHGRGVIDTPRRDLRGTRFEESQARALSVKTLPNTDKVDFVDDRASDPLAGMMRSENRGAVHQALQALPMEDRWILKWHYWRNLSLTEIGERLGLGKGGASHRMKQARAKLAEHLDAALTEALVNQAG